MPCGWEGNRRSGVALAMRHRLQWFCRLQAHWGREMSTAPMESEYLPMTGASLAPSCGRRTNRISHCAMTHARHTRGQDGGRGHVTRCNGSRGKVPPHSGVRRRLTTYRPRPPDLGSLPPPTVHLPLVSVRVRGRSHII